MSTLVLQIPCIIHFQFISKQDKHLCDHDCHVVCNYLSLHTINAFIIFIVYTFTLRNVNKSKTNFTLQNQLKMTSAIIQILL